jgi:hypothetical protein
MICPFDFAGFGGATKPLVTSNGADGTSPDLCDRGMTQLTECGAQIRRPVPGKAAAVKNRGLPSTGCYDLSETGSEHLLQGVFASRFGSRRSRDG